MTSPPQKQVAHEHPFCCTTMFGPKTSTTAEAVMRSDEKDTPQIVIEASDQSSSSGDPTTTHHTDDRRSTKSDERFTKQETKAVNRSKVLVYVALALAAAAVGALTYYFTSREEAQDFQDSVSCLARHDHLKFSVHSSFVSVDSSTPSLTKSKMCRRATPAPSLVSCTVSRQP